MTDAFDELTDEELAALEAEVVEERRREIAVEHLLFKTIEYVERQHPGLLEFLEGIELPGVAAITDKAVTSGS